MLLHIFQSAHNVVPEVFNVEHHLVGRCHNDVGLGVHLLNVEGGPSHGGGRRELHRLGQHLRVVEFGKLLQHQVGIIGKCRHIDAVGRHKTAEAVVGLLQQSASRAEEVEKLLGQFAPA